MGIMKENERRKRRQGKRLDVFLKGRKGFV